MMTLCCVAVTCSVSMLSRIGTPSERSIPAMIPRGRWREVTFDGTRVSRVGTRWGQKGHEGAAGRARRGSVLGFRLGSESGRESIGGDLSVGENASLDVRRQHLG